MGKGKHLHGVKGKDAFRKWPCLNSVSIISGKKAVIRQQEGEEGEGTRLVKGRRDLPDRGKKKDLRSTKKEKETLMSGSTTQQSSLWPKKGPTKKIRRGKKSYRIPTASKSAIPMPGRWDCKKLAVLLCKKKEHFKKEGGWSASSGGCSISNGRRPGRRPSVNGGKRDAKEKSTCTARTKEEGLTLEKSERNFVPQAVKGSSAGEKALRAVRREKETGLIRAGESVTEISFRERDSCGGRVTIRVQIDGHAVDQKSFRGGRGMGEVVWWRGGRGGGAGSWVAGGWAGGGGGGAGVYGVGGGGEGGEGGWGLGQRRGGGGGEPHHATHPHMLKWGITMAELISMQNMLERFPQEKLTSG